MKELRLERHGMNYDGFHRTELSGGSLLAPYAPSRSHETDDDDDQNDDCIRWG